MRIWWLKSAPNRSTPSPSCLQPGGLQSPRRGTTSPVFRVRLARCDVSDNGMVPSGGADAQKTAWNVVKDRLDLVPRNRSQFSDALPRKGPERGSARRQCGQGE